MSGGKKNKTEGAEQEGGARLRPEERVTRRERARQEGQKGKDSGESKEDKGKNCSGAYRYPTMSKTHKKKKKQGGGQSFKLNVAAGEFRDSEIIVLLGENGWKPFIRLLAKTIPPDGIDKSLTVRRGWRAWHVHLDKPQKIAPKFEGRLWSCSPNGFLRPCHTSVPADVAGLTLDPIMDQRQSPSGGAPASCHHPGQRQQIT